MRGVALLLALSFVTFSGCLDGEEESLRDAYGDVRRLSEATGNATDVDPLVVGGGWHIKVAGGEWGDSVAASGEATAVTEPAMAAPSPNGGGGDAHDIDLPRLGVSFHVDEVAALGDRDARLAVFGGKPGDVLRPDRTIDVDLASTFDVQLPPGHWWFLLYLYPAGERATAQPEIVFHDPLQARYTVKGMATGSVQPVRPGGASSGTGLDPDLAVADREEMVDVFRLDLWGGTKVSAATHFNGNEADATDVDLGIYDPAGTGVACVGSGTGTGAAPLGPYPGQAEEKVEATASSTGQWSIQVGAMADGCSGNATWFYNNHGPVPYTLEYTLG